MTEKGARKDYRQHSKSTLLKACNILFQERDGLVAAQARLWKRRLYASSLAAFAAGIALGAWLL